MRIYGLDWDYEWVCPFCKASITGTNAFIRHLWREYRKEMGKLRDKGKLKEWWDRCKRKKVELR